MKHYTNKKIFNNINSQVSKTSVVSYIKDNSFKKENNCEECNIYCGNSVDCYPCLLADAKPRQELDTIISKNKTEHIYKYLEVLQTNAMLHDDLVSKRLADIVESAMFLKLL